MLAYLDAVEVLLVERLARLELIVFDSDGEKFLAVLAAVRALVDRLGQIEIRLAVALGADDLGHRNLLYIKRGSR